MRMQFASQISPIFNLVLFKMIVCFDLQITQWHLPPDNLAWLGSGAVQSWHSCPEGSQTNAKAQTFLSGWGELVANHRLHNANFVCIFSWKEICVLDYFSYVKYKELCATINLSTSKILKIESYSKYFNNDKNTISYLSFDKHCAWSWKEKHKQNMGQRSTHSFQT